MGMLAILAFGMLFGGCVSGSDITSDDGTYTILYTNGTKANSVSVGTGEVYSLELPAVPDGYRFLGYFDAETGGTQYTGATGIALSPFTDKRNITLFPQYEAKTYTIRLVPGDATLDANSSFTVRTGDVLPVLPGDSQLTYDAGKTFSGWYTKNGKKLTDATGMSVQTISGDLLAEANQDDTIWLYARLDARQCSVTCYSSDGSEPLGTYTITYGKTVSDMAEVKFGLKTVTSWSETIGGNMFTDPITKDMTLYALSYERTVFDGVLRTGTTKLAGSGQYVQERFQLSATLDEIREQGFKKLIITLMVDLKEQDNCWQFISVWGDGNVAIGASTLDHGGSTTDRSWKTHTVTYEIDVSSLTNDILYVKCQAENKIFKDFYVGTVRAIVRSVE